MVMRGYRYVSGQVISLAPANNLPFLLTFDGNGKITDFDCSNPQIAKDYSQDIDFNIPETDFAQIIRFRESLEAEQTVTYLQNMTTTPPEAKQIILERIQKLQ